MSAPTSRSRLRVVILRSGRASPFDFNLTPRVLDEPTAALDPDSVARAEALQRERLAAGVAMILVTHDPAQAERLGTVRGHLEHGCLSLSRPA